jgi:hypothetical protein
MTTVSTTLTPSSLQFQADLNVGGIFTSVRRLAGMVAWRSSFGAGLRQIQASNGNTVTTSAGDFCFSASNLGLAVSGFQFATNGATRRVGGTFFATMNAQFNDGLGWSVSRQR